MSLCLPVHNGAHRVAEVLLEVSRFQYDGDVHVFLVANGCTDDSADRARRFEATFRTKGWRLTVLELEEANKPAALRRVERLAPEGLFAILDVNVHPARDALRQMVDALQARELSVVSGQLRYIESGSVFVRRFASAYGCAPFARSDDLKGTFLLFAPHHRQIVRSMPDTGSDDRFFTLSTRRAERASVQSANVDYYFPDGLRSLVRQQIRWKQNNRALDRNMPLGDFPIHASRRWPYLDPLPPLSATVVYLSVTLLATVVGRLRPRDAPTWKR